MIKLEAVTKKYQSGKIRIKALDMVSLSIESGEFVRLSGPSGSGKTTLLNIIGCLTRLTSGRLWLDDQELSHFPDHFLSLLRQQRFGFIYQQFNLLAGYTTWENVSLPLVPLGVPEKMRRIRAMKLLEAFDLLTRADFAANELSGGEQQRATIARALINDPDIILADEPLSSIGERHGALVVQALGSLKEKGKTIIVTSHEVNTPLSALVDRSITLDSGRLAREEKGNHDAGE